MLGRARGAAWSGVKNVTPVALGFGVGWGGWELADRQGWIGDEGKVALYYSQRRWFAKALPYIPTAVTDAFSVDREHALKYAEETGEHSDDEGPANAVPFAEIFSSCRVPEQCDWLMDHLSEAIPYFYIHDLFAAWATVHETERRRLGEEQPGLLGRYGTNEEFHRTDVLEGIWQKTVSGVLPVATGLRCLAILSLHKQNALWLNKNARLLLPEMKETASSEPQEGGEDAAVPNPSSGSKRGDFAASVLYLVKAKHYETPDAAEGDLMVEERQAHVARAALETIGNVNSALRKEYSAWWRGALRGVWLSKKEEMPSNLVIHPCHLKESRADGCVGYDIVKPTVDRLWTELRELEDPSIGSSSGSNRTVHTEELSKEARQKVEQGVDIHSQLQNRQVLMKQQEGWMASAFEK